MNMEIVFPGGKKVNALYRGFTIETDQPENGGGDGAAPSPFDLFVASIGACVGFYILSFCQERAIPTVEAKVILATEKNSETGLIGKITIEIQLPLGFPEKYKGAVERAAELCVVKKHLQNPPVFEIHTSIGDREAAVI